jgi:hypothetical protein
MQQVALQNPCLFSVGIAIIVLCTKAVEGLVESPVGAQPWSTGQAICNLRTYLVSLAR